MTAGFQRTVNMQQAAAVAGDFASANPHSSVVAHQGAFVAGAAGVTVGRFAWANQTTGIVLNTGTGKPTGFVHREQGSALITVYLAETSNVIPQGFEVTLQKTGDYWALNTVDPAVIGEKVFASLTDGTIQGAAAGATVAGYIETDFFIDSFPTGGTGAVGELVVISRLGN